MHAQWDGLKNQYNLLSKLLDTSVLSVPVVLFTLSSPSLRPGGYEISIPLVLVTGVVGRQGERDQGRLGMNGCLQKNHPSPASSGTASLFEVPVVVATKEIARQK